jgi:hypothetical protein
MQQCKVTNSLSTQYNKYLIYYIVRVLIHINLLSILLRLCLNNILISQRIFIMNLNL